jgi:hypothetical protein
MDERVCNYLYISNATTYPEHARTPGNHAVDERLFASKQILLQKCLQVIPLQNQLILEKVYKSSLVSTKS